VAVGGGDVQARFVAFLNAAGITVDDRVMSIVSRSSNLSSRVAMLGTPEDAVDLYRGAQSVPQSETRERVRRDRGITIDGDMLLPGIQNAEFFHAFDENYVPRVVKVPRGAGSAKLECALWNDVSDHVIPGAVFLVPVQFLGLGYSALNGGRGCDTHGVLMPLYSGTLARIPTPAGEDYAMKVIERIEPTLRFLNQRGWLHGDVKLSNIFLDYEGSAWLGDFGTSVLFAAGDFSGGTPSFQCESVGALEEPLRFDLIGLAVSVLGLLGLLKSSKASMEGWSIDVLKSSTLRISNSMLKAKVTSLLV